MAELSSQNIKCNLPQMTFDKKPVKEGSAEGDTLFVCLFVRF